MDLPEGIVEEILRKRIQIGERGASVFPEFPLPYQKQLVEQRARGETVPGLELRGEATPEELRRVASVLRREAPRVRKRGFSFLLSVRRSQPLGELPEGKPVPFKLHFGMPRPPEAFGGRLEEIQERLERHEELRRNLRQAASRWSPAAPTRRIVSSQATRSA